MANFNKVVSTVYVENFRQVGKEVADSFSLGADIVEIRIDSFSSLKQAEKLFYLIEKYPLIFSGNRTTILKDELKILLRANKMGSFIDLPFVKGFDYSKVPNKNKLIISYHKEIKSFNKYKKLVKKISFFSNYIKVVPPKENIYLCAQFLKWTQKINRKCNLIAFPSGDESKFARILSPVFGSNRIYSLSPRSKKTLEGQIELKELLHYHPKAISQRTKLVGLIGYPLNFTLSPSIWNSWFAEKKIDAVYLPFKTKNLQNALETFRRLKVKYFGVTSPYKTSIIPYLNKTSNKAKKSGSVNTVCELNDGTLLGFNTDIYGIRRALSFLKKRRNILILGNGGAARSAIFALKQSHNIFLSSRDNDKGNNLCREFEINFVPWKEKENGKYDIIINATSLGSDNISIPWDVDKPIYAKYILDLVVPQKKYTPFEKFAKTHHLKIIGGYKVLLNQAKLQFRIFLKSLLFRKF